MAEKKVSTSEAYKHIMTALKAGKVAPVYLLMGEEGYYIDKVYEWITNNLLTQEERDFNLTTMYGSDVTAQQVMDAARRFPIMAKHQVLIVREAQAMKDLDALEKYMDKPIESTVLVICHMGSSINGKKKIAVKAAAIGQVLVSERPRYDKDIVSFINAYIKRPEYNATIDERTAYTIAAQIGGDLKRLSSELDKLLLSFAPGAPRRITPELIEQKIGISKEYNVFEFRSALIEKNALKAQRIAQYFCDNPKAGGLFAVLPITFSFFQNLMLCYYAPRPITEDSIATQIGGNRWGARDYLTALRNYPARKTIQIISKIREVDGRSKGLDNNSTPPNELLKELVTFILH